jgi:hypothetical protein
MPVDSDNWLSFSHLACDYWMFGSKNRRLIRRISKILGTPLIPSSDDIFSGEASRNIQRKESAENLLFDFIQKDKQLRQVLESYDVTREDLVGLYEALIASGGGQWIKGHFLPVSTLTNPHTLEFFIRRGDGLHYLTITVVLLKYFERGEVGPVPAEILVK